MTTTTATAAPSHHKDSYLALLPRGLHQVVLDCITKTVTPEYHLEVKVLDEQSNEDLDRLRPLIQEANRKKTKKNEAIASACHERTPVGTTDDTNNTGRHISMGYFSSSSSSTTTTRGILSYSGLLEGVVWVRFDTDAPVDLIANKLRCVGPLLALATVFDNINLVDTQTLEGAVASIQGALDATRAYSLDTAVNLWQRHAMAWPLSTQDQHDMNDIVSGKIPIRFRVSCARHQSKQYKYTREALLRSVVDHVVPPARVEHQHKKWVVDLTRYNVEVVLLIQPTCVAIGLALRPYRYHGAKSFSSGTIPPDVATPYLSGSVLSGLVRLRPSTAHALLHLAHIQPGDIVLDPCAGIGTIPMELSHLGKHAYGFGGDVVLTSTGLGPVASNYTQQVTKNGHVASDLVAWDAIQLPLRSSSVDVIVSDLPFGQQCLSSSKLDNLLPLLMAEMARVLTPVTGRMVLLCGSYAPILETLVYLNHLAAKEVPGNDADLCRVWTLPCPSVFPVNVGGLLAWIIEVQRGAGKPVPIPNQVQRIKKVTRNRDRVAIHRARDQQSGVKPKHRRIQS